METPGASIGLLVRADVRMVQGAGCQGRVEHGSAWVLASNLVYNAVGPFQGLCTGLPAWAGTSCSPQVTTRMMHRQHRPCLLLCALVGQEWGWGLGACVQAGRHWMLAKELMTLPHKVALQPGDVLGATPSNALNEPTTARGQASPNLQVNMRGLGGVWKLGSSRAIRCAPGCAGTVSAMCVRAV
jgi:hypothetical protein